VTRYDIGQTVWMTTSSNHTFPGKVEEVFDKGAIWVAYGDTCDSGYDKDFLVGRAEVDRMLKPRYAKGQAVWVWTVWANSPRRWSAGEVAGVKNQDGAESCNPDAAIHVDYSRACASKTVFPWENMLAPRELWYAEGQAVCIFSKTANQWVAGSVKRVLPETRVVSRPNRAAYCIPKGSVEVAWDHEGVVRAKWLVEIDELLDELRPHVDGSACEAM